MKRLFLVAVGMMVAGGCGFKSTNRTLKSGTLVSLDPFIYTQDDGWTIALRCSFSSRDKILPGHYCWMKIRGDYGDYVQAIETKQGCDHDPTRTK